MAYGIAALNQALGSNPVVNMLAHRGRGGDSMIGHLTPGEMVLPKSTQTPGIMALLSKEMRSRGIRPESRVVGSRYASKNPSTGAQEFYDPLLDEGASGGYGTTSGMVSDYVTSGGSPDFGYGEYDSANSPESYDAGPMVPPTSPSLWDVAKAILKPDPGPVSTLLGGGVLGGLGDLLIGSIPGVNLAYYGGRVLNTLGAKGRTGPYDPNEYSANAMDAINGEEYNDTMYGPGGSPTQPVTTADTIQKTLEQKLQQMRNPVLPTIDYSKYAYGPEVLQYPWVMPDKSISYGVYPMQN